jgi:hypothetical protein
MVILASCTKLYMYSTGTIMKIKDYEGISSHTQSILHSRKRKRCKVVPVHTMKAQTGSIDIGSFILNLVNSGDQW